MSSDSDLISPSKLLLHAATSTYLVSNLAIFGFLHSFVFPQIYWFVAGGPVAFGDVGCVEFVFACLICL